MKRKTALLVHLSAIPALGYLFSMNESAEILIEKIPEKPKEDLREKREEETNEVEPSEPRESRPEEKKSGGPGGERASWDWDSIVNGLDPAHKSEHSPYISKSRSLAYMMSNAPERWKKLSDEGRGKYRTWKGMGGMVFNEEMRDGDYTGDMKRVVRVGSHTLNREVSDVKKDVVGGDEIHRILEDYTVGYETACGNAGTGWFLDYEIPEDGKYPLRWYMATSAQNLNNVHWLKNPYRQYRKTNEKCGSKLTLTKKFQEEGKESVLERDSVWSHELFYLPKNIHGDIYKMEENKWKTVHYMNDFAILEINFVYEEQAKKLTGNFYEKYHNTDKKRINFFSEGPGHEGLGKRYFGGGYRANTGGKTISQEGFTPIVKKSNRDLETVIKNRDTLEWNGKRQREYGIWYSMGVEGFRGTVGSPVVDSELNLLGLVTGEEGDVEKGGKSYAEPLKFRGAKMSETGEMFFPKYDLLMGAEGQIGSYREQLDTYHPNINTYLKSLWTRGTEKDPNSIQLEA